jgi:hypothetical protein
LAVVLFCITIAYFVSRHFEATLAQMEPRTAYLIYAVAASGYSIWLWRSGSRKPVRKASAHRAFGQR